MAYHSTVSYEIVVSATVKDSPPWPSLSIVCCWSAETTSRETADARLNAANASAKTTARSARPPCARSSRRRPTSPSLRARSDEGHELALVVLSGLSAVHGRLRRTVREEDHGREGEDAVASGETRLLVDVHADEANAGAPGLRERSQVWLDRVARLAPGRPEVDDHGDGRGEHLALERRPVDHLHDLEPAGERSEPEQRDLPHRLGHDRARHLRRARATLDEGDRNLLHPEAAAADPVRRLDLDRIAVGRERVEVDRLECRPPEALDPAGEVPHAQAQEDLRVEAAAARHDAAQETPVGRATARRVARAEHEVGVVRPRDQ